MFSGALSIRLSHGLQMPERTLKGDLLPRVLASDPPGEVASIEIGGNPDRVVLRDYTGDPAFVVDATTATTTVVKGTSIPQLKLPSARP